MAAGFIERKQSYPEASYAPAAMIRLWCLVGKAELRAFPCRFPYTATGMPCRKQSRENSTMLPNRKRTKREVFFPHVNSETSHV